MKLMILKALLLSNLLGLNQNISGLFSYLGLTVRTILISLAFVFVKWYGNEIIQIRRSAEFLSSHESVEKIDLDLTRKCRDVTTHYFDNQETFSRTKISMSSSHELVREFGSCSRIRSIDNVWTIRPKLPSCSAPIYFRHITEPPLVSLNYLTTGCSLSKHFVQETSLITHFLRDTY